MEMAKPSSKGWLWGEDRQWSRSYCLKTVVPGEAIRWTLEVRSENHGIGSQRLGLMVIRGSIAGELVMSIGEERAV